jgi:hypothetical protein
VLLLVLPPLLLLLLLLLLLPNEMVCTLLSSVSLLSLRLEFGRIPLA